MKKITQGLVPLSTVEITEINGASCPKRYYYDSDSGTLSTTKPNTIKIFQ